MKLLLIRHADPDYEHDSLTQKGRREAALLASRLIPERIDAFYVSPQGRARETARPTLEGKGASAVTCEWLHEFDRERIWRPDVTERKMIAWDWLPEDWTKEPRFYEADRWMENEIMAEGKIGAYYDEVVRGFDDLLASHGYVRNGGYYQAVRPNEDVLAFFCHMGLACVLLSHIFSASPMLFWHGLALAPSSVTTIVTEERRQGIASLRVLAMGDISHLYAGGEEPSFSARFCECFSHEGERHD